MGIIKSIKNYFRKRKERKKYIEYRKVFLEISHRECPHLWESTLSGEEYCLYKRISASVSCNPYRCSIMLRRLSKFDKEWKNLAK